MTTSRNNYVFSHKRNDQFHVKTSYQQTTACLVGQRFLSGKSKIHRLHPMSPDDRSLEEDILPDPIEEMRCEEADPNPIEKKLDNYRF